MYLTEYVVKNRLSSDKWRENFTRQTFNDSCTWTYVSSVQVNTRMILAVSCNVIQVLETTV